MQLYASWWPNEAQAEREFEGDTNGIYNIRII